MQEQSRSRSPSGGFSHGSNSGNGMDNMNRLAQHSRVKFDLPKFDGWQPTKSLPKSTFPPLLSTPTPRPSLPPAKNPMRKLTPLKVDEINKPEIGASEEPEPEPDLTLEALESQSSPSAQAQYKHNRRMVTTDVVAEAYTLEVQ
ncbi:hypothetical protein PIB30_011531 [Stylosanthes scabra]|uniref:Uncharacterized protein n=1 Tax=Stylosanthes scabra TaxID=79078 RepID=A0ABU6T7M6_9FABA|nr:hypothetical protein [Stylosanthes scabra]